MRIELNLERIIIIIFVFSYVIKIPAYLAKRECVNINGNTTTVLNLAKSPHKESYIETKITNSGGEYKEFFEIILNSEIVGMSDIHKRIFTSPEVEAFFVYSFYKASIMPVKLSSKTKPF